jgi:hypothetical protein
MRIDEFGFTNDRAFYESVIKFREAAIADGWEAKPTYGDSEPLERCASLTKDGFKMHIKSRENEGRRYRYEAQVSIWGPDRLAIKTPTIYDMKLIEQGLKTCNKCGAIGDMFQYSFAGRCCENCLPEMRKLHEYPGWTN